MRSPIGETLTAIREDEVSAASLGINGAAWKVFAFGVGSAVAGAAGCFYASFVGTLVPDAFFVSESFTILAMVIVGGMGTLIGPVFGAILLTVLPEVLRGFGDLRLVVYGAALTLVVLFMPGGLVQAARVVAEKLGLRRSHEHRSRNSCDGAAAAAGAGPAQEFRRRESGVGHFVRRSGGLDFRGDRAERRREIDAAQSDQRRLPGRMPGRCRSRAAILSGMPAHRRVRLGIARTFQKIRLFKQLSVLENVIAGFHIHHSIPAWQYVVHGAAFADDQRAAASEAAKLLDFVGMSARMHVLAGSLSYGEQRMLEFARALATRPQLLLIDEPAAGLNAAEVDSLLDRIRSLRKGGTTVVLVEHNMELVMNVADRDHGHGLWPASVRRRAGGGAEESGGHRGLSRRRIDRERAAGGREARACLRPGGGLPGYFTAARPTARSSR